MKAVNYFCKTSMLDVWEDSGYTSDDSHINFGRAVKGKPLTL